MDVDESTKVTLDLRRELTPEELESFRRRAEEAGNSLQEHLREICLGDQRERKGAA